MNLYNTVVIRKDLNMPVGLMMAQACHIQDSFMRKKILVEVAEYGFTDEELSWMETPYLHVLGVDNKEELEVVIEEAKRAKLPVYEWRDLLPSKNLNRNIPDILVGCAIGPCDLDKVKAITGTLPLA